MKDNNRVVCWVKVSVQVKEVYDLSHSNQFN